MVGGWGWFLKGCRVGLEVGWAGAQRSEMKGRGLDLLLGEKLGLVNGAEGPLSHCPFI